MSPINKEDQRGVNITDRKNFPQTDFNQNNDPKDILWKETPVRLM